LLRQLIVASDRAGREFVMWYLNSAFGAYQKVRESLQSGVNEVRSAVLPPLQAMQSSISAGRADKTVRKRVPSLEARLRKRRSQRKRRKPAR
jgi:hypothetical protein